MDPQKTDPNAAKTPPVVLEYQPVQQRRRSRLTGWDWSLMVAMLLVLVVFPGMWKPSTGNACYWVGMALAGRVVVGVVMRDRSRWWMLYLGLLLATPWLVDAASDAIRHGW
jgi:hypothetical protein